MEESMQAMTEDLKQEHSPDVQIMLEMRAEIERLRGWLEYGCSTNLDWHECAAALSGDPAP